MTPDGLYYSEMTTAELVACKGKNVRICQSQRSLQSFTKMTCAAALYKDNALKIMELCDIRYESKPVPPGAVRLADNTYLVHSNKAVVQPGTSWRLSCPLLPQSTTTPIPACATCIIKVDCGCELNAEGEFFIPLQLTECDSALNPSFPEVVPKYLVSLPVLHSIFTAEDLQHINGETLKTTPWDFDLPDLEPLEYSWNQSVEISERYKSDLKKIAAQSKMDRKLFKTKADALLARATDFSDLDLAHVNDLEDKFSNLEWLTAFNPAVTVSGVSIISIVAAASIIMGLANCLLIRRR